MNEFSKAVILLVISEIDKSYSRHFGSYSEAVTAELLILRRSCSVLDGKGVIPLESSCISFEISSQEECENCRTEETY